MNPKHHRATIFLEYLSSLKKNIWKLMQVINTMLDMLPSLDSSFPLFSAAPHVPANICFQAEVRRDKDIN